MIAAPGWTSKAALDLFGRLDITDSGTISPDDLQQYSEKMIERLKQAVGERKTINEEELQTAYREIWRHAFAPMDADGNGYVDVLEFLRAAGPAGTYDPTGFMHAVDPIADAILDAYDVSNNGVLTKNEVIAWLTAFDMTRESAQGYFAELDRGKNGYVTREELSVALHEYAQNPAKFPLGATLLFGAPHEHEAPQYADAYQRISAVERSAAPSVSPQPQAPSW